MCMGVQYTCACMYMGAYRDPQGTMLKWPHYQGVHISEVLKEHTHTHTATVCLLFLLKMVLCIISMASQ